MILIDRIVDMYAVTDFASSCPLDKLNMLLNRFPKTCSDVAVIAEPLIKDQMYVVILFYLSLKFYKIALKKRIIVYFKLLLCYLV